MHRLTLRHGMETLQPRVHIWVRLYDSGCKRGGTAGTPSYLVLLDSVLDIGTYVDTLRNTSACC